MNQTYFQIRFYKTLILHRLPLQPLQPAQVARATQLVQVAHVYFIFYDGVW